MVRLRVLETRSMPPRSSAANVTQTTVGTVGEMKHCLTCECGFSITASDVGELIAAGKHHARHAHRMTLSAEQLLVLTTAVPDVGTEEEQR
jgi:predicted small metal-binding protein